MASPRFKLSGLRASRCRQLFQVSCLRPGGARASIDQPRPAQVLAPVPPLPEQRAIAEALSDVDALLGALDRAHRQEARPQTGRHAATPHRPNRLPGFTGEWEVKRLGELADFVMARAYVPRTVVEHGVSCIALRAHRSEQPDLLSGSTIYVGNRVCRNHRLRCGDLLFGSCVGTGREPGWQSARI